MSYLSLNRALLGALLLASSYLTSASELHGTKGVYLEKPGSESIKIADAVLTRSKEGYEFEVSMVEAPFGDEFLSMRPFKCIDGDVMYCHLPYPYPKKNKGTNTDHLNLEYGFLFIIRSPNDYGIDPYNGRYFVLEQDGDSLRGTVYAVDLGILAVPPEPGITRPITRDDLHELEADTERFSVLVIR